MRSLRDGLLLAALAALPLALPLRLLGATFAHPWGLGLFGLALPVILLHMLRPKRTPQTVGSVLLWREVEKALDSRHPFERLRRNLPLFLQLLALAALTFALATPRLRGGRGSGRDCVLVLDASASMKTRDGPGGITRFEAARREARAVVQGLRSGERGLVIVATPRGARTAQAWTEDTGALEDAIAALEPSDGGAELGDALVPAAAAARAVDRSAVIVFSDGGDRALPAIDFQDRLRYRAIGASDENLGIVSAERSQAAGSVLVSVLNAGARARKAWVELLSADRKTLAVRSTDVPARSRIALVLEADLAPPYVIARVSPADGAPDLLASDDEVPLVVPAGDAPAVLVESPSKPLLRALEAARARVTSGPLDASVRLEIVNGGEKLDPVPCLVLDAKSDVGPIKIGEELMAPKIAAWDRDERLLRYVSLEDVELKRARKLLLGPGARPLIATDQGPIAALFTDRDVLRVVLGFDLAETS
ncbi:MAG TPA: VWA domain-containing protein, partial [Planctomycetota bacterium]|nr:VWA domain-containing protein [Planctomycetota bacterium]